MIESPTLIKINDLFGYADALEDLGLISNEQHEDLIRNLMNVRAMINQALNKHKELIK